MPKIEPLRRRYFLTGFLSGIAVAGVAVAHMFRGLRAPKQTSAVTSAVSRAASPLVTVTPDGGILIDGEEVSRDTFVARLAPKLRSPGQGEVHFRIDQRARHADAVAVMSPL